MSEETRHQGRDIITVYDPNTGITRAINLDQLTAATFYPATKMTENKAQIRINLTDGSSIAFLGEVAIYVNTEIRFRENNHFHQDYTTGGARLD